MNRKSYVTRMPDKTGAFLLASKIIAKYCGNIVRVSYNKAIDLHMLFLDVEATAENHQKIAKELETVGYLKNELSETRVIEVNIKIPDQPGAVLPVLKILDHYNINISYLSSSANGTPYQDFKMGLLIENPDMIKMLLDDISTVYQIDIIEYDDFEKNLDNTIFYIRLANEMQHILCLSTEQTMEFISESNRILQMLQETGESPKKVFGYIRRFAYFISKYRGSHFSTDIDQVRISELVTLYSIQPPCGSNTYVLASAEELVLIDTGYAIYAEEMFKILQELFPAWDTLKKRVFITHADVDHCGLLSKLEGIRVGLNQKSADSLRRQSAGIPDYRENSDLGWGYSKLSRIISGYTPPNPEQFEVLDAGSPAPVPEEHQELIPIAEFTVADLAFKVFEGSGGHLYGEMIFVCEEYGLVFTGDNLVNISGFSPERAAFNSLAPYLMRSVNIDSLKATEMRKQIMRVLGELEDKNKKPCLVCGGHGPISVLENGELKSLQKARLKQPLTWYSRQISEG
ncbi:MAG: MBL fold metallo-hydrolase [Dehalobacter sp. 4CP]|uniref:MBL fold metallo-hydrolase n=1 Tax=Dehalobacter sp. CP TaxID=2594474 RepID=UPI0013CDA278|nr:MBL fold metallo-hydrolase [Dehalobacter sp. 4CP]